MRTGIGCVALLSSMMGGVSGAAAIGKNNVSPAKIRDLLSPIIILFFVLPIMLMISGASSAKSFTDNEDFTVTDNSTGLVWQQVDDGVLWTWEEAVEYCDVLTLAGKNDWRLPGYEELRSLVDYKGPNPSLDADYFIGEASYYWSSTTFENYTKDAWNVLFPYSSVSRSAKTNSALVRCVSGGQ